MHPVMFRIPLPTSPTQWAIAFFLLAGLLALVALQQLFLAKSRSGAAVAGVAAGVIVAMRFLLKGWIDGEHATSFPIYSYGVMLGASLCVGWFLTLGLAERDGLPREQMGDCYVDTAIMAVIGARLLYIVTNLDQFHSLGDVFSMRSGGLVAYGGFLGGWLGSVLYLHYGVGVLTSLKRIGSSEPWRPFPLLPWADVAVPSLASGLMITRVGCYLFGCDFGKELPATAPTWLKALGTFPRWPDKLADTQEGAPAYIQHLHAHKIGPGATASLPVHPTQIYESLVGAGLLALLLLSRRHQKFRGEICVIFFYAYGICRYLLEVIRDDNERGSLPLTMPVHILIPLGLVIFAIGWCIGFSLLVQSVPVRRVTQVLSFAPALVAYLLMKPELFGAAVQDSWSTSQAIGLGTGLIGAVVFNVGYRNALAHPDRAMAMNIPRAVEDGDKSVAAKKDDEDDDDDDDDDDDEKVDEAPRKRAARPVRRAAAPTEKKPTKPKPKEELDEDEPAAADDDEG
jgi:phosphatidylglycerol:prolipoprotein diacylglycerol transferase